MPEERRTPYGPAYYWLIAKRGGAGWTEVFTVGVGGEEALPVFSFKEEAGLFLLFEDTGPGWRVRKTTVEEMLRALRAPRTGASKVVLDPLPAVLDEETNLLVSLGRRVRAGRTPREGRGGAGTLAVRMARPVRVPRPPGG